MDYLFNNEAGFQRGAFLKVRAKIQSKDYLTLAIGSFKELDKTNTYQLTKDEVSDLITTLTKLNNTFSFSAHNFSTDFQEAEVIS